jgi:ubiquinone/menaquinone biosynthesis C-methylase UbiE
MNKPYRTISILVNLAVWFVACLPAQLAAQSPAAATQNYRHINDNYHHPDVDVWVKRFEGEGRQVYDYRNELVEAIGLREAQDVADIGAGTGLFEPLLSRKVGANGIVYAVDIVPEFIDHIKQKASQTGLTNIRTVLSDEHSTRLPENSVDVVYICDAYHHFVYYQDMLRSIHSALRSGGQLFLVEYHKQPGVSSDWLINHIRGTREEFSAEIEAGGFQMAQDITIEGLEDTFVRRFIKK